MGKEHEWTDPYYGVQHYVDKYAQRTIADHDSFIEAFVFYKSSYKCSETVGFRVDLFPDRETAILCAQWWTIKKSHQIERELPSEFKARVDALGWELHEIEPFEIKKAW
jgi:hypothetical protein